jgi:hypothetical protein
MGKYFTDIFPTMNSLKQWDGIWPLPCKFVLEYGIFGFEKNKDCNKMEHILLAYADDVNLLAKNTSSKMKGDFSSSQ